MGKALALHEMRTVMCHVMQRLEMSLPPKWDSEAWQSEIKDIFVTIQPPLPVVVRPRY